MVPAEKARPLAMALHELAVNAAKHGAMSRATGRVHVSWTRSEHTSATIDWVESGGPSVGELRPGAGMKIVRGLVEHEIGGQVTCSGSDDGVTWRLVIPLE